MKQQKTWQGSSTTRRNSALFLFVFLGTLTAFAPFVTDMYLPSLPAMTQYFGASASAVQLGITASMLGLALGQLFFGPLSDKYGRRILLLTSMWLYLLATLGCIFAPSIEMFVVLRLVQGMAAAGGVVIARSIATDKFKGKNLAKALAIIGALNGIAPVAAPVLGAMALSIASWRGIFGILLILGIVVTGMCLHFKESLSRTKRSREKLTHTLHLFKPLFANRTFICYVGQLSCAMAILFGYIAASPFIIQEQYGFSAFAFSLFFAVNSVAVGVGAGMSVKFHKQENCVRTSCVGMVIGSLFVAVVLILQGNIWWLEAGFFGLLFMTGMTFTAATTLAMDSARKQAGAASALLGASGFLAGSIVSPLVGLGNILVACGVVLCVCALLSCLCARLAGRATSPGNTLPALN